MKNKKGENIGISYLLYGILAILVIIVLLYAFSTSFRERVEPFIGGIFPTFKQEPVNITGNEIVGYSIMDDKAQYYDGTSWKDFPKGSENDRVTINDKIFLRDGIYLSVRNFYYSSARPVKQVSYGAEAYTLDRFQINYIIEPRGAIVMPFSKEEIIIKADNSILSRNKGGFSSIISTIFGPSKISESDIKYSNLKKEVISWRNSILSKPIEISYLDDKGINNYVKVCAKIFNGRIVIDLSGMTELDTCEVNNA